MAKNGIEYLGSASDVRPFIAKADCVVLPSLSRGTPSFAVGGRGNGPSAGRDRRARLP